MRGTSMLPPRSLAAQSTMTAPRLRPSTPALVSSIGGLRPETLAVVMMTSNPAAFWSTAVCWAGLLLGAELAGVSALALPLGEVETEIEELRAQRLHFAARSGTHVVRGDHGAQTAGGADGLQAGDARAQDQQPRPGGSCQRRSSSSGRERAIGVRRHQRGLVPHDRILDVISSMDCAELSWRGSFSIATPTRPAAWRASTYAASACNEPSMPITHVPALSRATVSADGRSTNPSTSARAITSSAATTSAPALA